MRDSELIESLDALRTTLAQRLKSANTLIASLKAANIAQTKTLKALTEYGERTSVSVAYASFGDALAQSPLKSGVEALTTDLKREVRTLTKLTNALKGISTAFSSEGVEVQALDKALKALKALNVNEDGLMSLVPRFDDTLRQAQEELGETFGEQLRDALSQRQITIGGRPPTFEIGRFELRVNVLKRKATLLYGKIPVQENIALGVSSVLKAYDRAAQAIMERSENGEQWIAQFYEAWTLARRRKEAVDLRVNVIDCYFEMFLIRQKKGFAASPSKDGIVDYTRAQFAYDLNEFASRKRLAYKGEKVFISTATKAQAESIERSLWLVTGDSPNDGSFVGDIKFARDE